MPEKMSSYDKGRLQRIFSSFNQKNQVDFQCSLRGKYIYVFVVEDDGELNLGRIEYHQEGGEFSFAIYKYSDQRYHPDELGYPGFFEQDGTLDGALMACLGWYEFTKSMY